MEMKIPGVRKLRERIERGNPLWAATQKPCRTIITNNLLKALSQHATQSRMRTKLGLLESGKLTNNTHDGSVQPVVTFWEKKRESQPSFFHEKTQHDGTAQSIVNEVIPRDRTGQPVVIPQRGAWPQQFIIGNDETEIELSMESRSFSNRVNDQVRKRQKRSSMNVTEDGEKHSMIWGMFMSVTMESAVFKGKNYLDNWHSIANTKDLTLKQMIDISAILVSEQDEISGLETIGWENHSWKYLSLIGEERIINLNAQRSTSFRILYCVLVRYTRTPNRTMHGKTDWDGSNLLRNTETLTESTVSRWTSSGIFSQDSIRCSSVTQSKVYC